MSLIILNQMETNKEDEENRERDDLSLEKTEKKDSKSKILRKRKKSNSDL